MTRIEQKGPFKLHKLEEIEHHDLPHWQRQLENLLMRFTTCLCTNHDGASEFSDLFQSAPHWPGPSQLPRLATGRAIVTNGLAPEPELHSQAFSS